MLKSATRIYCLVRDSSFSDLEDEYEPRTSTVFTENVSPVLAYWAYSIRTAPGRSESFHDVFSKRDMENAVRVMGKKMARGAHEHMFCLDLGFFHWNRSFRTAKKKVEKVEGDLERE